MADVQSGLATLGPNGWEVIEPSEGGEFGPSPVSGGMAPCAANQIASLATTSGWSSSSVGVPVLSVSTDAERGQVLTITTDGTVNNHDVVRTINADLSVGDAITLAVMPGAGISLLNVAVSLGDTSFSKYAILMDAAVPGSGGGSRPDFVASTWRTIGLSAATVVALAGGAVAADLAKVRAIRIRTKTSSAASSTLKINKLQRVRDTGGPRIIWVFDDERLNQYTNAFPILRDAGYVGHVAVMPASFGTIYVGGGNQPLMSESQFAEMYAAGWSACGHAETNFSAKTQSQIQADLDAFLNWSIDRGYTRGRSHWAYVGGWWDEASAQQVLQQFVSGRRVGGTSSGFEIPLGYEPKQVNTYYITQSLTLGQMKAKIDALVAKRNGVLVMTFHNVVDTLTAEAEDITTANFAELVAYAKAQGCKSTTMDAEFGSIWS